MADSLIPVAPGMDEPLEVISACHDRLRAQLDTLGRLVRWLPEHGADEQARGAATAVMRYFDVAAVNHHQDEETDLIPALRACIDAEEKASFEALAERILAEHRTLFCGWADIRGRLVSIAAGEDVGLDATLVGDFAQAYRRHIELEEAELLPLARRLLGEAVLARLGAAMTERRRH